MFTTKNNLYVHIRQANENDAQAILDYAKLIFASTDQVLTIMDEFKVTLEQEKAWLREASENANAAVLVAEHNQQIVALLDFFPKPKMKIMHSGEFGMSVHPHYQGLGIGRAILKQFIEWAQKNKQNEKIILNVLETNTKAIALYQSMGFIQEGLHLKAIKQLNGHYVNILQMYLFTKPGLNI